MDARKRAMTRATTRVAPTDARNVTLTLTDFVIPPDDVPQEVGHA